MATASVEFPKFNPGFEPESIALAYTDGKPMPANKYHGDQLMFTLVDGRKWFADLYVGRMIEDMGIQRGEVISVQKTEIKRGNQRVVQVEINPAIKAEMKAASIPPPAALSMNYNNNTTGYNSNHKPAAAVAPVNGIGETSAAILARCYRDAVDIALTAVAYAKENGLLLTPEFADIRAMAATLAINETGGRR